MHNEITMEIEVSDRTRNVNENNAHSPFVKVDQSKNLFSCKGPYWSGMNFLMKDCTGIDDFKSRAICFYMGAAY